MKCNLTGSATATFTVFIVSGILASILGVRQVDRLTTVEGWVLSSHLPAGQVITRDAFKKVRLNNEENGITTPGQYIGKRLKTDKQSGDSISPLDLQKPVRSTLAQKIPDGRVLYTIVPHKGSLPHTLLRNGDRIDVLARGRNGVRTVAEDVRLIGTINAKSGTKAPTGLKGLMGMATAKNTTVSSLTAWVVAVFPYDVYPLANISSSEEVSLVLHGKVHNQPHQALQIKPQPSHRKIELVNGITRKQIKVRR